MSDNCAVERRALLAGIAATAVATATPTPAEATPANDAELLDLYARWREVERQRLDAEMLARRLDEARPADVEWQAILQKRDDISEESFDLLKAAFRIAPTTQAGFAAILDMMISMIGGRFDPDNEYCHEQYSRIARTLEAATGMTLVSLAHCRAYRGSNA